MKYEFEDKKMVEVLAEKDKIVKEGRDISKEIEKLEMKRNQIGLKIEKVKGKAKKWVEKNVKLEGEFEEIERMDVENGKIVVHTFDMVEEYKDAIREKRKQLEQESK